MFVILSFRLCCLIIEKCTVRSVSVTGTHAIWLRHDVLAAATIQMNAEPIWLVSCSAAKLCHFGAHGGQIILPSELAEVVLADWTGSVPPMPSAGQSLFLTANHVAGSNVTGSNWDSATAASSAGSFDRSAAVLWLDSGCGCSNSTFQHLHTPRINTCVG